jgi:hypothetical protein
MEVDKTHYPFASGAIVKMVDPFAPFMEIPYGVIARGGPQNRLPGFGQGRKKNFLVFIPVNRIFEPTGAVPVHRPQSQKARNNPGRI